MAIHEIRRFPDPVLRKKAKRVPGGYSSLKGLVADMIETMQSARGVGLAAPQIGLSIRLIVIQLPEEEPFAMVNPEVVKRSGEREIQEGCLSIPGYAGMVKRSLTVTVKGHDLKGKEFRIKGEGLLAQALDHELDHLNGVLYIDHLVDGKTLIEVKPGAKDETGFIQGESGDKEKNAEKE